MDNDNGNGIYGWIGKILRVDLSSGRIWEESVEEEIQRFLGGRGLGAWYAWKELPPGIDGFDEENRLMFLTGPLTGTLAPTSGRFEVCGIAPQAYPRPHYTRSNVGGHWGPTLKYAGYDGVIVQGRAARPSYLWIEDGRAEVRDAGDLWGLDTFETQQQLKAQTGFDTEVMCIGPSGENLVRIAVIQSSLENAAGQGGFGAVMGSKNLKAVAVRGTGGIRVADPETFLHECTQIHRLIEERVLSPGSTTGEPQPTSKACTLACTPRNCAMHIKQNEEGEIIAIHCCSPPYLRYQPPEAGFRAAALANRYGINHWEMTLGYGGIKQSWFRLCKDAGVLTDDDFGMPFDLESGEFWCEVIRKIAYREGIGDALAEGVPRAADVLGKGHEFLPHVAYGYETHWDGHLFGSPIFPYWLVSALMWATDSRDPLVHGYAQEISRFQGRMTVEQMMQAGARTYGSERSVDPESGYEWKTWPTVWHQNRLAVKDSLPVCDQIFPLIFHASAEDGYADVDAESRLFSAATGLTMSRAELDDIGARIFHLERAIMVRDGRTRSLDEEATQSFFKPDARGVSLDPEKFWKLLDEFYPMRGWDPETGRPTRATLEEAGLTDVADTLGI